MSYIKICDICNQKISMREMPGGQWVAFDPSSNKPHRHYKKTIKNNKKIVTKYKKGEIESFFKNFDKDKILKEDIQKYFKERDITLTRQEALNNKINIFLHDDGEWRILRPNGQIKEKLETHLNRTRSSKFYKDVDRFVNWKIKEENMKKNILNKNSQLNKNSLFKLKNYEKNVSDKKWNINHSLKESNLETRIKRSRNNYYKLERDQDQINHEISLGWRKWEIGENLYSKKPEELEEIPATDFDLEKKFPKDSQGLKNEINYNVVYWVVLVLLILIADLPFLPFIILGFILKKIFQSIKIKKNYYKKL